MRACRRHFMRAAIAVLAGATAGFAQAQSPETFYKGRNVSLVMGTGPGGSYDLYGRLIAAYLPKFIPGQPNMIVEHMPGAGGVRLMQQISSVAPRDGTYFGFVQSGASFAPPRRAIRKVREKSSRTGTASSSRDTRAI